MINIVEGVKKYSKTDRLAVVCRDEKLSYKDLDRYSDILANFLIKNKMNDRPVGIYANKNVNILVRSEEHTSELQSRQYLVCRLLLEKKKLHNVSRRSSTNHTCISQCAP